MSWKIIGKLESIIIFLNNRSYIICHNLVILIQATDNTVNKWKSDIVDFNFTSSDSESNASSTDEEDQVDNPGWQEDMGICKRDTLGQWDEIYKIEMYPIVWAAGALINKANLNNISYSGRALDGLNPWASFVNAKDYDLAK